jgi:hypothetical protein
MDSLPLEILYTILNSLDIKDIISLATTNYAIYNKIKTSSYFWHKYYLSYFNKDIRSLYYGKIIEWNFVLDYGRYLIYSNFYSHKQYHKYLYIINNINVKFTNVRLGYYLYPSANFTGFVIYSNGKYITVTNGITNKIFTYTNPVKLILNILIHERIDIIQVNHERKNLLYLYN